MEQQKELLEVLRQLRKSRHRKVPYGKCHPGAFMTLVKIQEFCEENPSTHGIGVGELAERLGVSSPAVSKMLRNVEEKGMIERTEDRGNRRNVYIRLSEEGRSVLREAEEAERARVSSLADFLGAEDTGHLIRIMERMQDWEMEVEDSQC